MLQNAGTLSLLNSLLAKGLPFAAYRLPGKKHPTFLASHSPAQEFLLKDLDHQKGFVAAPYNSYKSHKAFLIKPDLLATQPEEIIRMNAALKLFPSKRPVFTEISGTAVPKTVYLHQVNKIISRLKKGDIQKVVLSRTSEKALSANFDFDLFFHLLQQDYPRAFVYLFFLPGQGLWAGATPETFFKLDAGHMEIMALAGTQKQPIQPWQAKEKEEQAFVVSFVEEQLRKLGLKKYEKSKTETLPAGQVAHLCTRFRLPRKVVEGKTGLLAELLHPTPAVCGLPREKAWQLIARTEKYERRFYTGFLGPWQINELSHLFVNLRCAVFSPQKITLYAGGGLTAASLPEKEWQETEDKLQTLLSVVEKMRNFAP